MCKSQIILPNKIDRKLLRNLCGMKSQGVTECRKIVNFTHIIKIYKGYNFEHTGPKIWSITGQYVFLCLIENKG